MAGGNVYVYIARGEHYNIPGEHFSVHATRKGANEAALVSLHVLCRDLSVTPPTKFRGDASLEGVRAALRNRGMDEFKADVWVERRKVNP